MNTRNVAVPRGYRPVWEDDRLNPHRAEQTLAGRAQMRQIWTDTLPRRLVNPALGRDRSDAVPVVYTRVPSDGGTPATVQATIVSPSGTETQQVFQAASVGRPPTYSSRSAPRSRFGKRHYIALRAFNTTSSAEGFAQQIVQLGLPARIVKKSDAEGLTVQAGPFLGRENLDDALQELEANKLIRKR